MGINVGTVNPGTDNKKVGGTSNSLAMGNGGPGLCGTPVWNDFTVWDDFKVWID